MAEVVGRDGDVRQRMAYIRFDVGESSERPDGAQRILRDP
jgi:hypothetical protein